MHEHGRILPGIGTYVASRKLDLRDEESVLSLLNEA